MDRHNAFYYGKDFKSGADEVKPYCLALEDILHSCFINISSYFHYTLLQQKPEKVMHRAS